MDENARRQVKSDIADLEATIRRERETIRTRIAMIPGARPQDAREHETVIRNLENDIKYNEQRIAQLKRSIQ